MSEPGSSAADVRALDSSAEVIGWVAAGLVVVGLLMAVLLELRRRRRADRLLQSPPDADRLSRRTGALLRDPAVFGGGASVAWIGQRRERALGRTVATRLLRPRGNLHQLARLASTATLNVVATQGVNGLDSGRRGRRSGPGIALLTSSTKRRKQNKRRQQSRRLRSRCLISDSKSVSPGSSPARSLASAR